MPFSKRRKGVHKYSGQKIVVPMTCQMPPVPTIVGNNTGGFSDANVSSIPSVPSTTMECDPVTCAESPLSATVGTYNFNFSRLFSHNLGGNEAGGGTTVTLASFFKRVKFSTGYMTIERIKTPPVPRVVSTTYTVGAGPTNAGSIYPVMSSYVPPKPEPLRIYYVRLSPHESTFSQVCVSPVVLRADPRCRVVTLMPGKSVTFKFRPVRMRPPTYISSTYRDRASGLGQETDQYRRLEIPGKSTRLGWVPSSLVARQRDLIPYTTGAGTPGGLGPDVFPIISPTIAFHFDVPQEGFIQYPSTWGGVSANAFDRPATNISANVLIRRREFCAVSLAEFIPPMQPTGPGVTYQGIANVGQIIDTVVWNTGATSSNTVEVFDPPRITSLANQTTANYALWRPGQVFAPTVFLQTSVPYDTEQADESPHDAPAIAAVNAVP